MNWTLRDLYYAKRRNPRLMRFIRRKNRGKWVEFFFDQSGVIIGFAVGPIRMANGGEQ